MKNPVAEPRVPALESLGEQGSELVAPQPHRLVACLDSTLGEQGLDVAVAEVEAMVEPPRVLDDGRRESVPLIGVGGSVRAGMVAQALLT